MKAILLALSILVTTGLVAAAAAPPHGLYALWRPGAPVAPIADGVTLTIPWSDLEPGPAVYDWSMIDAGMRVAGNRPVMIGVEPGVRTPEWVYAAGARSISMTWTFRYAFAMCATVRLPVPWDPVYVAAWTRFIAALGARFTGNPRVSAIKIAGINGKTIEQVLPVATPAGCPGAIDPLPEWQAAGYRPSLLTGVWDRLLRAYAAAFPTTPMVLQTGNWSMPGIDDLGRVRRPDWMLTTALMRQFADAAGGRAILENDALGATSWQWRSPLPGVPVAEQAGSPVTPDRSCRMAGGHPPCDPVAVVREMLARSGADVFVEFYPPDVNNPSLAGLFAARFRR